MREISGQVFTDRLRHGVDLPTGPNDPELRVIGAVDLRGQVIESSRVAYAVHFLGAVDFREATIKGTLDLTACVFEDPVLFENAEIEGSLILSALSAPTVNIHGIVVGGELDLSRANLYEMAEISDGTIRGSLDMSGMSTGTVLLHRSTIEGNFVLGRGNDRQVSKINVIDAAGAKIFGNVEISGIGIAEEKRETEVGDVPLVQISLINSRIHGSVNVKSHAESVSRIGSINLSGSHIQGDVVLADCYIEGGLAIRNATINGNTVIHSTEAGDARVIVGFIDFSRSRFLGYMMLVGVLVKGPVSLTEVRLEGILVFETSTSYRTEIDGELNLGGVKSPSQVVFFGIRVTGPTTIIGAEIAGLMFRAGIIRAATVPNSAIKNENSLLSPMNSVGEVFPFQTEALFINQCLIKGDLSVPYLQVFGSRSKFGRRGFSISDSHITGSVVLWSFRAFRDLEARRELSLPIKPWLFSSAIIGNFRIRRCKIEADCDLTFVKVSGVIDLSDTEIKGDLTLASTITCDVQEQDESGDLVAELRQIPPLDLQVRATCKEFRMRMVRCESDVDLTGLTILAERKDLEKGQGGLDARYLQVKGDVQTYFLSGNSAQKFETYAEIPGCLDLSHANLARLVVSAHSFPAPQCQDPENANPADEGIVFTRAKIEKLEIPETRRQKWKYPIPINLEDITVDAWEMGDNEVGKHQGGQQFIALLENDRQFRRSTYRAIEHNLRNGGQDDQANAVYRSMKDRDWREYRKSRQWQPVQTATKDALPEKQKPLKGLRHFAGTILHYVLVAPIHYLFKYLLQYGTNPERLLLVILLLALSSLPIYRNPANFEASLELLAPNAERFTSAGNSSFQPSYGASPPESVWGWDDAIAMMIRYHVPVASLVVRSDWQPHGDPGLFYGGSTTPNSGAPSFKVPLLTPEDFTNLMQLLNLICWPLLITFWIRKALRQ